MLLKGSNLRDKMMRKACIELIAATNVTCLVAGELGTGRCLYMVVVMRDIFGKDTKKQRLESLKVWGGKTTEIKKKI